MSYTTLCRWRQGIGPMYTNVLLAFADRDMTTYVTFDLPALAVAAWIDHGTAVNVNSNTK